MKKGDFDEASQVSARHISKVGKQMEEKAKKQSLLNKGKRTM